MTAPTPAAAWAIRFPGRFAITIEDVGGLLVDMTGEGWTIEADGPDLILVARAKVVAADREAQAVLKAKGLIDP